MYFLPHKALYVVSLCLASLGSLQNCRKISCFLISTTKFMLRITQQNQLLFAILKWNIYIILDTGSGLNIKFKITFILPNFFKIPGLHRTRGLWHNHSAACNTIIRSKHLVSFSTQYYCIRMLLTQLVSKYQCRRIWYFSIPATLFFVNGHRGSFHGKLGRIK